MYRYHTWSWNGFHTWKSRSIVLLLRKKILEIYTPTWPAGKNKVAGWYGALACTTFLFFVILSSGTWNALFVVLLKSPDVNAHEFRVAGPWLQEEIWCFALAKRWFQKWNCKKKTLDFVFFKADHPKSSLMIMWIFFVNEMEHAICYL